jgi:hypothetical protein
MGESLEARMEAAEKELATAVNVEPRTSEDSHTTVGLRTSAGKDRLQINNLLFVHPRSKQGQLEEL